MMFGCGLMIRLVCVLAPDRIARTIGDENNIGRSRTGGLPLLMRANAAVHELPEVAVRAEQLVAIARPAEALKDGEQLGAGLVGLPVEVPVVLDVIELQEGFLGFAAAGAAAAVCRDHLGSQLRTVFGAPGAVRRQHARLRLALLVRALTLAVLLGIGGI